MSLSGLFPIDKWDFKSYSILNNLPEDEYLLLSAHMSEHSYKKGEILFREGAVPTGIFFIRKGKVKKYQVDRHGREQIIYLANSGELLGYHAILADERLPDYAATLEESIISFIPREDFLTALEKSTVLTRRLLKTLSHEFAVMANGLSVAALRTVKERLAISLIVLREKFKENTRPGDDIIIDISRADLASMTGTGKENIVRGLKEFRMAGIIITKGRKICVTDIRRLVDISGYSESNKLALPAQDN